jgi:hypothetical protein
LRELVDRIKRPQWWLADPHHGWLASDAIAVIEDNAVLSELLPGA